MVDALDLIGDEGRGKLRKAEGSCIQALYPQISEWDNLIRWRRIIPTQVGKPTRGTDTSKYPVEKKIKMIPLVVASEEGRAQTWEACLLRVVGPHTISNIKQNHLESWSIEGERPVCTHCYKSVESWVARDQRNPVWICRYHPVRLNTH